MIDQKWKRESILYVTVRNENEQSKRGKYEEDEVTTHILHVLCINKYII